MPAEERVLCFKRELFENLGVFQGLCLDVDKYFPVFTASANLTYKNRSEAEKDPHYKQLIPYVLILCGDKILRYQRGKGGGETRLHGLFSVGVGGHISEDDKSLFSAGIGYHEAMWRELMEEVAIEQTREATVGLINDDSTEVGRVHLGVVHVVHVPDETVASGRDGMVGARFVPIAEAVKDLTAYESWSSFCLAQLGVLLARVAELVEK